MFRNAEYYADPTAGRALANLAAKEHEEAMERIKPLMRLIHQAADMQGFEVAERIVFRDKQTGREYR